MSGADEKAEKKAEAAAKKAIRTANKVKKRQDAKQSVTNMVIQEMLASKNPPQKFYDANRCPVTKKFLPSFYECKNFMQVHYISKWDVTNVVVMSHILCTPKHTTPRVW